MVTQHAKTRAIATSQRPAIDEELQSRLVSKFGSQILREGFTAVPVTIQRNYRYVPGNPDDIGIDEKTGEILTKATYMTPTEFNVMTDIWTYWWKPGDQPWPSIPQIAKHLNKSEKTIQRYIKRLQEKGFMLAFTQYNAQGKQLSNRYDFSPFLQKFLDYLNSVKPLEKPIDTHTGGDTFGRERVTQMSGGRVTLVSPKTDKSEIDSFEKDKKGFRIRSINSIQKSFSQDETFPESSQEQTVDTLDVLVKLPWRHAVEILIRRCTVQFNDQPALLQAWRMKSNVTRAHNLVAGLIGSEDHEDEEHTEVCEHRPPWATQELLSVIFQAQEETQRRSVTTITTRNSDGTANKMPYFFQRLTACLTALQEQKEGALWVASLYPSSHDVIDVSDASEARRIEGSADEEGIVTHETPSVLPVASIEAGSSSSEGRSVEDIARRAQYARRIREQLRNAGVFVLSQNGGDGTEIDREHRCGCPLYVVKGLRRVCAHCVPELSWSHKTQDLIASILDS
jgi:DNA-binding Lrp family transcriptional regulator